MTGRRALLAPSPALRLLWPRRVFAAALLSGALACGDDGSASDAGNIADAGTVTDTGAPVDSGSPDAGAAADTGIRDVGMRPDAGYYCTMNGQEQVDGQPVPVPEATMAPSTTGGAQVSTRCIDRDVQPFDMTVSVCFTQCLDFFGYEPTPSEVQELELDVFPVAAMGGGTVDPSYDFITRMERSPSERTGVGATVRATAAAQCDSGYQVELGYLNLGAELSSETEYVIRVRSRAATNPTWATLYVWDWIRRLDEANQVSGDCSNDETRIPERGIAFPAIASSTIQSAIQSTTASVAGSENLFDGRGEGYALVETRDCSTTGSPVENVTVGFAPSPATSGYLGPMGGFDAAASDTSARAVAFGLGLGSATSSVSMTTVRAAVGINREGACTETFGGTTFPVFPDSVTFVRTNRETTIQPVF